MLKTFKNYKKLTMISVVAMMMATSANANIAKNVRVIRVGVADKNNIYVDFSVSLMRSCKFKNFDFLVKRDRGNILKALLYAKSHRESVDIEYEPSTTPYRAEADCKLPIIKMVILK